jgi:hypothetical protein
LFSTRLLRRAVVCVGLCGGFVSAQSSLPRDNSQEQFSWIQAIWELPIFRILVSLDPLIPPPAALRPAADSPCSVAPLPAMEDLDAILFEASAKDGPRIDLKGLTPATSRALTRFQRVVGSAGGDLWLTSAYRPPAYQEHLQSVWDKWAELRDNQQPGCQELKTAVAAEFSGHQLLNSQRPVSFSDHTRGTGFDAAVTFSAIARHRRRRVSIDRLARLAGVHRPDIAHDPVHFRLITRSRS